MKTDEDKLLEGEEEVSSSFQLICSYPKRSSSDKLRSERILFLSETDVENRIKGLEIGRKILDCTEPIKWILISTCGNFTGTCGDFSQMMVNYIKRSDYNWALKSGPFDYLSFKQPTYEEIFNFLQKYSRTYDVIYVIIPGGQPVYKYVKKAREILNTCVIKCIRKSTLDKLGFPTCTSLVDTIKKEVDSSEFYSNRKLPILDESCLVISLEIITKNERSLEKTHIVVNAPYGRKNVVFSWIEMTKSEIIENFQNIFTDILSHYIEKNYGKTPRRMVLLKKYGAMNLEERMNEMCLQEMADIKEACSSFVEDKYKLSMIVISEEINLSGTSSDSSSTVSLYEFPSATEEVKNNPFEKRFFVVRDDNEMTTENVTDLLEYMDHVFLRCRI